jgi:predicted DNA repair protein MutK
VRGLLRLLAAVLLIGGLIASLMATQALLGDGDYYRAASALERHADHILFQAEYQAALARHTAYLVAAVVCGVAGIVGGAILFALAAILTRVHRLEARAAR